MSGPPAVSAAAVLASMSGAPAPAAGAGSSSGAAASSSSGAAASSSSGAAAAAAVTPVDALRTMTDVALRALYNSNLALWKRIHEHIRAEIDASAERYRRFAQNIPNVAGTNAPSAADQARLDTAWATHTAVIDQMNKIMPA